MEKVTGKVPVNENSIDVETILSFEPFCKMITENMVRIDNETKQKFISYYHSLISEQLVSLKIRITFCEDDEVNIGVLDIDFTHKKDMERQLLKAEQNQSVYTVKNNSFDLDTESEENSEENFDHFSTIKNQISNLKSNL